jgi:hypothetical protein
MAVPTIPARAGRAGIRIKTEQIMTGKVIQGSFLG